MVEPTVSDSRIAMWHAIIALAYVDGVLQPEEKAMLQDYIGGSQLPAEIKQSLLAEIDAPKDFTASYNAVTDMQDRGNVISTALVLFNRDHDYAAAEKQVFEMLDAKQLAAIDMNAVHKNARKAIQEFEVEDDKKIEDEIEHEPFLFRVIDRLIQLVHFDQS